MNETSENVAKKSCVRDKSDSESSSDDSTFSSISQTKVSAPIDEVATIVDIGSFNEELENSIESKKKHVMRSKVIESTISEKCLKATEEIVVASEIRTKNFSSAVKGYLTAQLQTIQTLDTNYDDFSTIHSIEEALDKSSNEYEKLLNEIDKDCS